MQKSLKAKVALFFGYNGESFQGLQYQRDTDNTVENILHRVLCQQGFVLKTNMDNLKRIKWSRAGRTDKKVHALCNGISCSLEFDDRYILDRGQKEFDLQKVARDINADLPMDIRVFTIKRVGKGFDMRHDACSRVYNYLAPLNLFLGKQLLLKGPAVLDEIERAELVAKLNHLCSCYLGTHSFHNFTKGYKMDDKRCDRYMMGMKVELVEPETVEDCLKEHYPQEEERAGHRMTFLRFTLIGQSFIYHQIRKMVGLLVKICYEQLEGEETIRKAFGKQQYDVYLAPGQGLYLNRMTFDLYNKKNPVHKAELNEEDEQRIKQYRRYLQSKILSHQLKDGVFSKWLERHDEKGEESEDSQQEGQDQ